VANNVIVSACPPGENRVRRKSGIIKLRLPSWNIRSLMEKSIELAKALHRHKIRIACLQETKWLGAKANEIDGYKLWYSSLKRAKNGVGILVGKELVEQVVEVRRKSDRIMSFKLVVS